MLRARVVHRYGEDMVTGFSHTRGTSSSADQTALPQSLRLSVVKPPGEIHLTAVIENRGAITAGVCCGVYRNHR